MNVTLYIQRDKGKQITKPVGVPCQVDLCKGHALAGLPDGSVVADLKKATVSVISANGFLLAGVEEVGLHPRMYWQEWWCIPCEGDAAGRDDGDKRWQRVCSVLTSRKERIVTLDNEKTGVASGEWAASWDCCLTDKEVEQLAAGCPPWEIRPDKLMSCRRQRGGAEGR